MTIDRKPFFDSVRRKPFNGSLNEKQVDGMNAILAEWERRGLTDLRWLAYIFSTTYHETAHTMQPIKEIGGAAYFTRMYDVNGSRPALARQNGNVNPGDGPRYCGRGYVQLTWRNNYRTLGRLIEEPLEQNPDLAMKPNIASKIMFEGMIRGSFTGKKLSQYFNSATTDWSNARRIINGTDRASLLAGYAKEFHRALKVVTGSTSVVDPPVPKPAATPQTKTVGAVIVTGAATVAVGASQGVSWTTIAIIVAVTIIVAVVGYVVIKAWRK